MLLSHETTINVNDEYSNIIGHMCFAASKLWNVCNYEKQHYKELGLSKYPDWYYQKAAHKDNMWYKSLPAQSAQEVCKLLEKSWKSFTKLLKTGGVRNPKPPRFKQDGIAVTYMQKGIVHEAGTDVVRLSISRSLKKHMMEKYGISTNYLFLKNSIFQNTDDIKQIHIYPPENGKARIIVVYEVKDIEMLADNGHYLSIDLGLHNLMTCYDNQGGSFILGRKYLPITTRYYKEIARIQSQWALMQKARGIKYPKLSKHALKLYREKNHCVKDYLHKVTRYVAEYCKQHSINTVVIGDITGIREGNDNGSIVNQQLHGLPYKQLYTMLEYKLRLYGIRLEFQEESYTSQCSPSSADVSAEYAQKDNRIQRGLYQDEGKIFNADVVGAYNILRKYAMQSGKDIECPDKWLDRTEIVKVAV